MNKSVRAIFLILIVALFLIGCSIKEEINKEAEEIKQKEIDRITKEKTEEKGK